MLRVINAALVWLAALAVGFSLTAGVANADGEELLAKKEQYESEPFLRFIPSIPQVMMIVERDWKIYYPAYNNLSDLNGDGSIDIGFNPSITYVGYYDINSCYSHDGSKFYRVGPTTPHTQAQADSERPADLKANIPSPASAHGICTATSTDGKSPGTWHGNWLNFALTSRIDAIRKVLYGGKRSTDTAASGATPSLTILEPSYVPSNAFVFGAEVISDDLWNTHSPDSTYFRSDYYTALPRPTGKYMHFFARVDHTPYGAHVARSANPLLRILYNVDSTFPHPVSQNKVRYWDWIYGANILPDDTNMPVNNTAKGYTAPTKMALTARVQVCNPANYSETEGCARYGNSVKPIGLIQQYGERNSMQFGLITAQMSRTNCTGGTLTVYDSRCNDHGGLLRHHIDKVLGVSVNPDTGQIVAGQLLDTLSKFELADYVDASQQYHFNSSVNTGNPVGEMAMEALRYLSGATSGLPAYGLVGTEMLGLTRANWANRPASTVTCVKPFVLVISDVYPTYDGNDIPSATQLSAPILTGLNGLITFNWDMAQLLEDVTKNEGYRTSGHQYYYPKTDENFANRGLCVAKNFNSSLSLSNIRGFCPSEPSLSGSYSLVAAAYYGRTHDFTLDDRNTPAEFFVVGLSPNIPQVSIADGRGHQANIMPIVVVAPSNSGNVTGDNVVHVDSFPHTRTLINFIMKRAQADKNGYTFRLEYMTNFESAAEPYDIWERDHLNNADVALLTDAETPERYRETTPYYINSGPFKTTQDIINSDYTRVVIGPGPYYAFKSSENPNDPTDITQWNVVGIVIVTNSVGSDTSWSSSIGYTINGVVHSGAYLEASSHGNDFRVPTTSNVYPFQTPNDTLQRRTGVPKGNGALGGGGWPGPHLHIPSIVVDPLLTPWECAYAGDTSASGAANCGHGNGSYPTSWNNIYSWASNSSKATVAKKMRYIQVRSFEFAEPSANQPLNLPNPLWLAAKYGGYKDLNGNGKPDPGEWDTLKPGSPDNYFEVANLSELPEKLGAAFDRISRSGDAITATSDSVTSVLGGGLALQTSYVPEFIHSMDEGIVAEKQTKIKWVGNVYSLFLDQWGHLREDTNYNGKLDVITKIPGEEGSGDLVVRFENQADSVKSKITLWADEKGTNVLTPYNRVVDNMYGLRSVWDTSQNLAEMANPETSRTLYAYTGATPDVYAGFASAVPLSGYLFNQTNKDSLLPYLVQGYTLGAPRSWGTCDLVTSNSCGPDKAACKQIHFSAVGKPPHSATTLSIEITTSLTAGQVVVVASGSGLKMRVGRTTAVGIVNAINNFVYDINAPSLIRASLNPGDDGTWTPSDTYTATLPNPNNPPDRNEIATSLIRFVTGVEIPGWRSRKACSPWENTPTTKITWRMGDVINSKPTIVGEPVGGYDLIYGDYSYSQFKKGAISDGGTLGRRIVTYFGSNDGILHAVNLGYYGSLEDGTIGYAKTSFFGNPSTAHDLGAEIWGFIPTSVLPHLSWMTDPAYSHSYYVDLEPMIVDIRNTSSSTYSLASGSWTPGTWKTILVMGLRLGGRSIELDYPSAPTRFLYSEYFALDITNPEVPPTLLWRFSHPNMGLPINKPAVVSSLDGWHIVIGSGPTSDVERQITEGGVTTTVMAPIDNGQIAYEGYSNQTARLFVLNAYTGALQRELGGETNEGVSGANVLENSFFNNSFVPAAVGPGSDKLILRGENVGEIEYWHNNTVYFGLTQSRTNNILDSGALMRLQMVDSYGNPTGVSNWKLTTFYNPDRPVTGAVNATFDAVGNLWVVFGTGKLWSEKDSAPACDGLATTALKNACQANHVQYLFGIKEPMSNGVLTYGQVVETNSRKLADVSSARVFPDGTVTGYNGASTENYEQILTWMRGDEYLGYKRKLNTWAYINPNYTTSKYEMILTQPKIDALPNGRSIMVVTTYEPSNDFCSPEGNSFLMLADTFTGIPAPYMSGLGFDKPTNPIKGGVNDEDQITGYLDAGRGQATEAWVIKTTSGTDYGDNSANQVLNFVHRDESSEGFISGTLWWREVMDMGFSLDPEDLEKGLLE